MPKVKTHSRAKKTFKLTKTGEIKYQKAGKRHLLRKKSAQQKRRLSEVGIVGKTNKDFVMRLLRLK